MRSMSSTIARVSLISAVGVCLAMPAPAHPRTDEGGFRVKESYQTQITGDQPAVWTDRGIRISARPVFVRGAATAAGAVTGFDVSIDYQPEGAAREVWLPHAFIGNRAGSEQELGPFASHEGTGIIIEIHVHSTRDEARLEFRLASDGIVIKDKPEPREDRRSGFTLYYASKPIPEIQFAKRVYEVYSTVTFILDVVKLARAAITPQAFLVGLVVGVVVDQAVALIPEEYTGLVGYTCKRCGRQGRLDDFSGCVELDCPGCDNAASICFRSVDLDMDFTR